MPPDEASGASMEDCPLDWALDAPSVPAPPHLEVTPEAPAPQPPAIPPVVDVQDLDGAALAAAVDPAALRARMPESVAALEARLDTRGVRMLFDEHREHGADRVLRVAELSDAPLWFIGDLHGDLLALEAALALIAREGDRAGSDSARVVLLGDLIDDGGYGLETVLRIFEMMLAHPESICHLAGNHDEALGWDGGRFTTTVSPSHFSEYLNAHLDDAWTVRAGRLLVRLVANAPRALFFPDGLLAAHGGFPLADLHATLASTGDWNDPRCLTDFVWSRAHPRARKKLPNRNARGSQFGYEDFAAFCAVSGTLGRPVTHMVRGHDHVDERYEIYPAYAATPVLTTVALSRRLDREMFGPYVRVPTVARWVRGALPQVHRLHVPEELVRSCYPEAPRDDVEPVERVAP